uniref:Uncharacterized protein n=1 Tax=Fagus sylvatica TaxID=28930 RepID=A0A2N9EEF6_FAGSY
MYGSRVLCEVKTMEALGLWSRSHEAHGLAMVVGLNRGLCRGWLMRGVFGEIGFNGVVEVLGCVSDAAKNTELKKYLGVAFAAVGTADELDVAMVGTAPTE